MVWRRDKQEQEHIADRINTYRGMQPINSPTPSWANAQVGTIEALVLSARRRPFSEGGLRRARA